MARPTLCLNMIVRNEENVIATTLQHLCSLMQFDYWVISDTGSTDATMDIITQFFKARGIPGQLVQHVWKDFGHNRTEALRAAYNKTDYLLIFDADDSIHGDFSLPKLSADMYEFTFGPVFVYKRTLLINNRKRFKFVGVLHEYLQPEEPVAPGVAISGTYYVQSGRTGNRSQDPEKYLKDANILRAGYESERDRALAHRYAFYCAQSYKDYGDKEQAIHWYALVADTLDNWHQERYYACMQLGQLYQDAGNFEKSLTYYLKSKSFDEERIEGYATACMALRAKDFHVFVTALFEEVQNYQKHPKDKLFMNTMLYHDVLEYECSISAYYVKKLALGYLCSKRVLTNGLATPDRVYSTLCNLQFYKEEIRKDSEDVLPMFYTVNNLMADQPGIKEVWSVLYQKVALQLCAPVSWAPRGVPQCQTTGPTVLLTVTTCKRLDLFTQTVNSVLRHWTDKDMVTTWLCVDDNSSEADRAAMRALYPWMTFCMKTPAQRGHRESMNIIWARLRDTQPRYWVHLEDDFVFHTERSYVGDAILALKALASEGVRQVLFNRNYAEVVEGNDIAGHEACAVPGIVVHKYQEGSFQYPNCHYWPHYSFRPSVVDVETVLGLGNFDSASTFFEMDYAKRWTAAGHKSAFFDAITCRHIGRLTDARSDKTVPNAYELNSVSQFGGTAPSTAVIKIVNLERRQDRREDMVARLSAAGVAPHQYAFHTAVDGEALTATPGLAHLFRGNDFGSRRGFIGCALSHVSLWQEFVTASYQPYVVVLEDDVQLCDGFKARLDHVLSVLPADTDCVMFGYSMPADLRAARPEFNGPLPGNVTLRALSKDLFIGGTFGYVLTQKGAKALLAYADQYGIKHGVDYFMMRAVSPALTTLECVPQLVFTQWNEGGQVIDSDIQHTYASLTLEDDSFVYLPGVDIIGNDSQRVHGLLVWQSLDKAAEDPGCVGFNTLGFFKNALAPVEPSRYFGAKDGIYLKRAALLGTTSSSSKRLVRVKLLCNWCSAKELCNEFSKFATEGSSWRGLSITWEDVDVDYYVIINKPQPGEHYDPARTVVFTMEPWCHDPAQTWGVKTWGEWAAPDPAKFLGVCAHATHCNLGSWQVNWTLSDFESRAVDKRADLCGVVSTVCSSKYCDPGHKKRIDFLRFMEARADPDVRVHIYGWENQLGFKSYQGQDPDKTKGILPYQYYFMCENNAEHNYITEKLWEPLLCESLCFYWGAPNVADWVDPRAYIVLDMDNFDAAFAVVKAAISSNAWQERLPFIRREKQRVLQQYSFFPTLDRFLSQADHTPLVCFVQLSCTKTLTLDVLGATFNAFNQVFVFGLDAYPDSAALPANVQVIVTDAPNACMQAVHAYVHTRPLSKVLYWDVAAAAAAGGHLAEQLLTNWCECVAALDTHDCAGCPAAGTNAASLQFLGNCWWAAGAYLRALSVPGQLSQPAKVLRLSTK